MLGALIIVCLAVIFLPMLFDEPHQERERETLAIPPEPDVPEVRVEEPVEPKQTEATGEGVPALEESGENERDSISNLPMADTGEVAQDEAEEGSDGEPADTALAPETGPDTRVLEGAYLVQLGSFSNGANARRLRDRVRKRDIEAYMEPFERDGEKLTRVFAGPFVDKAAAKQAKSELDEAFGLETLVMAGGD